MKKSVTLLCAVLAWTCLFHSSFAANEKAQAYKTICNKAYKIVAPNKGKQLGLYSINAVLKKTSKKIEIVESISLNYRGKKVEIKSTVIYQNTSPLFPIQGIAETKINEKLCMKGTVKFSEMAVEFECTGFLNKRTDKAIDPPKKFANKKQPIPEGIIIFQSALPVIGPLILPKEGELKNIVFVEFPDDIGAPELINFKKGYRLVRGKADKKGEYDLKIYNPHSKNSVSYVRFNKDDQIISIPSYGKMKLVEIEEEKK